MASALACTALAGVALSDVMTGLMLAVLSLVMLLYRASRPYIAILGQRATAEFGDLERHPDAQRIPGLVMLRLDAPLYFFNANVARTQISIGCDDANRIVGSAHGAIEIGHQRVNHVI